MPEIDVSEVQGGEYVLVVKSWDQITSKPSEPYDFVTRHYGDVVTLDRAEAKRLVKAGAVVTKEAFEKASQAPSAAAAASPVSVLDDEGLARLREKLGLEDDADQDEILEALEDLEDMPPAKPAPWWGDGDEPTNIEAIEKKVGNDRALAAAALAAETTSSSPRKTLIDKLAAVVTAAS